MHKRKVYNYRISGPEPEKNEEKMQLRIASFRIYRLATKDTFPFYF